MRKSVKKTLNIEYVNVGTRIPKKLKEEFNTYCIMNGTNKNKYLKEHITRVVEEERQKKLQQEERIKAKHE
jgi:hypothetical protein